MGANQARVTMDQLLFPPWSRECDRGLWC